VCVCVCVCGCGCLCVCVCGWVGGWVALAATAALQSSGLVRVRSASPHAAVGAEEKGERRSTPATERVEVEFRPTDRRCEQLGRLDRTPHPLRFLPPKPESGRAGCGLRLVAVVRQRCIKHAGVCGRWRRHCSHRCFSSDTAVRRSRQRRSSSITCIASSTLYLTGQCQPAARQNPTAVSWGG
jgi:hypothetical protein